MNKIQIPAFFDGFWQSEKYFLHNENIIRKDLQFKTPLNGKNKAIASDILDHNSVALHIRRGEYKNFPHFGMCDTGYYKRSVSFIENGLKILNFLFFPMIMTGLKKISKFHIQHIMSHIIMLKRDLKTFD